MPPTREAIVSKKAPEPIGPYSHAVRMGNVVYTSGQVGLHPETKALVVGGITPESRQTMENLKNILESAGSGLDQVIKCTVFLVDIKEFPEVNRVYAEYFSKDPPARSCIQVGRLPLDARVEIEAIALTREGAGS
ncbi:ribonuclease UK114-like [Tropilaelaps mercedesae]|uniref:Ribonuclease UK114-like n=1 Tax=Tropilaelaps mercedesae TaxID=418985 RepID=A0A1V9XGZ6_9ACAR|nr:ribonuclease UK114-like [Tropilaelaps mercedesae]